MISYFSNFLLNNSFPASTAESFNFQPQIRILNQSGINNRGKLL
uniref:Uncharacterized protein n=1 Tax=Rhizophora mucronata TaxID=61149 RepID=A0A2P2QP55_RHIMU